jgi:hypothetical protein
MDVALRKIETCAHSRHSTKMALHPSRASGPFFRVLDMTCNGS